MDISAYFGRISYQGHSHVDYETLRMLHASHMQTVPFENLDIGLKRPILLDEKSLWNKIVINNRGGFCYELNGLFAELLKAIGYDVTYLNARVFNGRGELGIDFDHLALLVRVPREPIRWLVDVGFGDSFNYPLNFEERDEQLQGLRAYRVEEIPGGYVIWQKNFDSTWERQYFFDLQPHLFPDEYEAACLYHQTSPNSSFTRGSIISKATIDGRVSLEDGRLILTRNGQRTVRAVRGETEYAELLKQYFDITKPMGRTG